MLPMGKSVNHDKQSATHQERPRIPTGCGATCTAVMNHFKSLASSSMTTGTRVEGSDPTQDSGNAKTVDSHEDLLTAPPYRAPSNITNPPAPMTSHITQQPTQTAQDHD